MRIIFQIFLFVLPWFLRRRILNRVYHWEIATSARISRFSFLQARKVILEDNAIIESFVFVRKIDKLKIFKGGGIAKGTLVVGYSTSGNRHFQHVENRKCELFIGENARVVRHRIDCTAGVYVEAYTTLAGVGSQFFTHSIDIYNNRQDAKPIHIGKYCMIGSRCIFLPGATIPDYSVVGAGSVVTKKYYDTGMLYAGVPARPIKKIDIDTTPYFHRCKSDVD